MSKGVVAVSELAWERAKLSTCFGGLGIRVAQMGLAAQATYWSAVDLHEAVMSTICEALDRPLQGAHPEETTALAAKADLLMAGVAVDDYAMVIVETDASNMCEASPWAVLCRRKVWRGTWRSPRLCRMRKRCRQRSYTAKCLRNNRPSCSVRRDLALARAGRPCTNRPLNWHRNAQWRRATALRLGAAPDAGPRSACALRKANVTVLLPVRGSQDQDRTVRSSIPAQAH